MCYISYISRNSFPSQELEPSSRTPDNQCGDQRDAALAATPHAQTPRTYRSTSSTRRFLARPASVALPATGA